VQVTFHKRALHQRQILFSRQDTNWDREEIVSCIHIHICIYKYIYICRPTYTVYGGLYIYIYIYIQTYIQINIYKRTYRMVTVCRQDAIHKQTHRMATGERWGAGVETQKNVRGEIGGWGRVPFNETYAPSLSTIYDGA